MPKNPTKSNSTVHTAHTKQCVMQQASEWDLAPFIRSARRVLLPQVFFICLVWTFFVVVSFPDREDAVRKCFHPAHLTELDHYNGTHFTSVSQKLGKGWVIFLEHENRKKCKTQFCLGCGTNRGQMQGLVWKFWASSLSHRKISNPESEPKLGKLSPILDPVSSKLKNFSFRN